MRVLTVPDALVPGHQVAGYVIERRLGGGSSADVYLARRPEGEVGTDLPARVALKVLHEDEVGHPRVRDRFEREFGIAHHLHHERIVAMYARGEVPASGDDLPVLWIAMQYAAGPSSTALIPGERAQPNIPAIVRITTQTAAALDYAHAKEVIHRDVKPANILLTDPELDAADALLGDFGIAQFLDDARPLARNGRVKGSIAYASPELLQAQHLSPATDQYALACSVMEWLTGLPPYPRSTAFAITYSHLRDPIPKVTRRRDWLPSALNSVFEKALAKGPAERYATCSEFTDIVARALRDVTPPEREVRRRSRFRRRG